MAIIGIAVVVTLGVWLATGDSGSEVGVAYLPVEGEVLAEVEIAEAGPLHELPTANGGELSFVVHGHTPACQVALAQIPEASEVVRIGSNGTVASSVDPVCRPLFLPDGRFVATTGFHDGDLRSALFDTRDPAAEPVALPDGLGQLYLGSPSSVVGAADVGAQVLVSVPQGDGTQQGLELVDVESGERRRLVDPGDLGDEDARIAAAHLQGDHLVVVTAEVGAVGGEVIPWVGHRMEVVTQLWFGHVDGELTALRQMGSVSVGEDDAPPRMLLPPRIIEGPEGPLVVSLETAHPVAGQWDVVVTTPDGASRIVGRVPGQSSAGEGTRLAIGRVGGPEGGSLDAAGSQVLITGAVIDSAGGSEAEPQPIGLVLDLVDGTWYRLPEPVTAAGFVTDPPD